MKSILYPELANLRQDEIDELTSSVDGFAVLVEGKAKDCILAFLENERRYSAGQKSFRDRIAYLWGGRHAFFVIPFVVVWNQALLHGLKIESMSEAGSMVHLNFDRIRRSRQGVAI